MPRWGRIELPRVVGSEQGPDLGPGPGRGAPDSSSPNHLVCLPARVAPAGARLGAGYRVVGSEQGPDHGPGPGRGAPAFTQPPCLPAGSREAGGCSPWGGLGPEFQSVSP